MHAKVDQSQTAYGKYQLHHMTHQIENQRKHTHTHATPVNLGGGKKDECAGRKEQGQREERGNTRDEVGRGSPEHASTFACKILKCLREFDTLSERIGSVEASLAWPF